MEEKIFLGIVGLPNNYRLANDRDFLIPELSSNKIEYYGLLVQDISTGKYSLAFGSKFYACDQKWASELDVNK